MPSFFWDASALAKRFVAETGTDSVNALFGAVPPSQMATTLLGVAETYAILCRRRNSGGITSAIFATVANALHNEITTHPDIAFPTVEDTDILASLVFIARHNLNSTDALLLTILLREKVIGSVFVLVSADARLIRAATAEGVPCLNPEQLSPPGILSALASL